ncbi:MAG: protein kinase [Deltaproteobacteria bacterium]|nr:protein kinase [Deltaproteobacteria bacterium]
MSPPGPKPPLGRSGARTFGRFVLEERLASGGTADVFLARPLSGQRPAPQLVIKRLLASLRADPSARVTFLEEAALHRRFRHPNIVECYEVGDVDGEPFLAIELVQGADLQHVLKLNHARRRPIPPPIACHLAREVLAALSVVHGTRSEDDEPLGVVHRDVSPSNIYLSTDGDVKLGDFGIARDASSQSRPSAGSLGGAIKGKFAYLAPEQVASDTVDQRADLFAVANVLAEMMLGRPLFPGSGQLAVLLSIRDVRVEALDGPSAIPLPLVTVLKRALARDPARRFQDAASFSEALAPFALQDRSAARREVAQLVHWARQTSLEMRAVGEHPDQRSPSTSAAPRQVIAPSAAREGSDKREPRDKRAAPALAPRPTPSLHLDSSILRDDPPTERRPVPEVRWPPSEPAPPSSEPRPAPSRPNDAATTPFAPPPSLVRTSEGRLLGPFAYAKLIELVVTGHLAPEDEVDFMGTGFSQLGDIDELARHLAPRSGVTRQLDRPGPPEWHGFAAERYDEDVGGAIEPGIATALAFAASRRATGVLLAQQGVRRKEIYVVQGRILHVGSTEPGEMLGEYLVARGLLDRGDLDFALAVLPRFDGRLGEALASLGLLDPMAMFKAIAAQGRDKIVEIFGWSDGEISFYTDAQPGKVEFPLDLPVGPVIEAGLASMLDETTAVRRYRAWLERRIRPREVPSGLRDSGWSPHVERALLSVRQPTRVAAVLDAMTAEGVPRQQAIVALESARVAGLVEWS